MVTNLRILFFFLFTLADSFASDLCPKNVLREYVLFSQKNTLEASKEFNDVKKLSARVSKQLRPLKKDVYEAYKIGQGIQEIQAEYRRVLLIVPQTTATKNQIHDLEMAFSALTRDLIDKNNSFILKMQELFKKEGIPSEVVTSMDNSYAWRMFEGANRETAGREVLSLRLTLESPPTSNEGFNYYRRIQRTFGIDRITLSLSDTAGMGAGGIFYPELGRLEIGPMGAMNLLSEYVNVIGKHESRHAMFQGKRMRGEASIFHTRFQSSPDGNLLNDKNFYELFMSAEEVYTFSTDLQSLAQVFKGDYLTDPAKRIALLAQIEDGNQGLMQVSRTASEVTKKMIESLDKKLKHPGPTSDVSLTAGPRGSFDFGFTDELGRSTKISFVSEQEKKLLASYQSAVKKMSDATDEYITKKLVADGVDIGEFQRMLSEGVLPQEEMQKALKYGLEFSLLPKGKKLNNGQKNAYRQIVLAAKTKMVKLNQIAEVQLREAQYLDGLLRMETNPAQIEEIKKQLFIIGKSVKEDYKGFGLNPKE